MFDEWKILLFVAVFLGGAMVDSAVGQTMRTEPSADATDRTYSAASETEPLNPYPSYRSTAPAVPLPHTTNPYSPIHILTADQARSQIEAKGFSGISRLQKDTNGFWRGKAMKNGKPVDVSINSWGDLVAK
jgi:hypothetical protein